MSKHRARVRVRQPWVHARVSVFVWSFLGGLSNIYQEPENVHFKKGTRISDAKECASGLRGMMRGVKRSVASDEADV